MHGTRKMSGFVRGGRSATAHGAYDGTRGPKSICNIARSSGDRPSAVRLEFRARLVVAFTVFIAVALVTVVVPSEVDAATPIVVTLRPVANGPLIDWSKSGGGKNFEKVDEAISDGDSTYVYTSTGGAIDTYVMEDLPYSGTIGYLSLHVVARRTAGDCDGTITREACIQHGVGDQWGISGGNSFPLGTSYTDTVTTWTTKPFSTVPWTGADVNSAKAAVMKYDSTSTVRVTQVWFEVQITPSTSVVVLRPNANGPWIAWRKSGGGGSNFDRVDDATSDGDATYVYTSQGGAQDLYELGGLTIQGTIDFVRVVVIGRVSSGTCTGSIAVAYCVSLLISLDEGGPSYGIWAGNVQTFGSTYSEVSHTWTAHPATGQPWSVADVNALRVGMYKADSTSTIRITQVWLEVQITPTG